MSGARRIVVEFLGDDKSLGRTADDVGDKTDRLGSRMGKVGKIAALGLAGGVVIAGKALFDMGKAAIADQQGQKMLEGQLKRSANATGAQVKATEDWISAQGKALGVTDDELRPALSRLVKSTHDVGEAQDLAALAMDASAGSGKSLESVTNALAKAHDGSMGALKKLGIETEDAQGKALSFDQVTKNMAGTFEGAASEKANTLQGKMSRLKIAFDETKESIGAKLIPVVTQLAEWFVNTAMPAISNFTTMLRDTLGPVFEEVRARISAALGGSGTDISGILTTIMSIIRGYVTIVQAIWAQWGDTIMSVVGTAFRTMMGTISGVLRVIQGVVNVFAGVLTGDWSRVWTGVKQIFSGAWGAITSLLSGAAATIRATISGIGSNILNTIRGIPGKLGEAGGLFKAAGKALIGQFVDGMKNAAGIISGIAGNVWSAVKSQLNGAISRINSALNFEISIPGKNISIHAGNIPHFAKGGIVKARRGGTLGLIGEAGHDEAVVPLSGPNAPSGWGGGGEPIQVNLYLDSRLVHQSLVQRKADIGQSLGLS